MHASPFESIAGPVAVLHQAIEPPTIEGARKPAKRGGYADSGADIAFALRSAGVDVITPAPLPDPAQDDGWTFPDSREGIIAAQDAGARVLWANTVLFAGHPLEHAAGDVAIAGHRPADVHRYDDKWHTRNVLRAAALPVPAAILAAALPGEGLVPLAGIDAELLARAGIGPEVVVKPVRGRGSQGVTRAHSIPGIIAALSALFSASAQGPDGPVPLYGTRALVEEFLPGDEITITVLPPGRYVRQGESRLAGSHWALPPIRRAGHRAGIAPYSGDVTVARNSEVIPEGERSEPGIAEAAAACERAASLIGARAAVRIDCRRSGEGGFALFDVNLKPNLTGPDRPGREQQESLVAMAGRAEGWSYAELLLNLLRQAWRMRA